MKRALLK